MEDKIVEGIVEDTVEVVADEATEVSKAAKPASKGHPIVMLVSMGVLFGAGFTAGKRAAENALDRVEEKFDTWAQKRRDKKAAKLEAKKNKAEEKNAEALISYIGMGGVQLADISAGNNLEENDIIILSSDGLYKRLSNSEVLDVVMCEEPDMKRAAKRLTDVVMKRTVKSQDNTSVVVMQYNRYQA